MKVLKKASSKDSPKISEITANIATCSVTSTVACPPGEVKLEGMAPVNLVVCHNCRARFKVPAF